MSRWHQAIGVLGLMAVVATGCSSDDAVEADSDERSGATSTTVSTGDSAESGEAPVAPLDLDWDATSLPVALTGPNPDLGSLRFATDISCGDDPLRAFDIVLPQAAEPGGSDALVPLVIYIHGGGFIAGDKAEFWADDNEAVDTTRYLDAGVAVASMNYRLLADVDTEGVIKPMSDAARCLQFIRHHAASSFGIDAERIVLTGGSAGAGTALWLNFHNDLAEPDATDPISRQSTRPLGVAVVETQATYDLLRWGDDVFAQYKEQLGGADIFELAVALGQAQRLLSFFGAATVEDVTTPEYVTYRENVDMLALMSPDDAPFWVSNVETPEVLPTNTGVFFHHADHARALAKRAAEVGLDAEVTAGFGLTPSVGQADFVLAALGVES